MRILIVVLLAVSLIGVGTLPSGQHADRIFINGKIWTADTARPRAEALAISGDKILAVGSNKEILALRDASTSVVDLKGRLVVPGFQDSHVHFPGLSINAVELDGLETLEAFQNTLGGFAKSHPNLKWISGGGWGYSVFPNQAPDKKYIVSERI